MFTIIGGDGKEYGPVTTEQVRNWIATGRANLDTKAKAAGSEEWRRLGDFAEFGGVSPELPPLIGDAPAGAAPSAELAGRGARFVAALIDGFIKTLCWLPTSIPFGRELAEQITSGQFSLPEFIATYNRLLPKSIPFLLGLAVVQAVLLTIRSQSIGKVLLGIRIVRTRLNTNAGFLRAFVLRSFVPWLIEQIPVLGGLFWLVDTCFIFGDERRCLHDLIADTKVVKIKT
jgi:uncharacterized RDD family membrane protein YckC